MLNVYFLKTMGISIYVTHTYLPPLGKFVLHLQEILDKEILTVFRLLYQRPEGARYGYLGLKYLAIFTNSTLVLVTTLRALGVAGEIITTPYFFVSTAHSLQSQFIKTVLVEIDSDTLNPEPTKIDAAIPLQKMATATEPVYGHPTILDGIKEISESYNLKVIYKTANAFGMQDVGCSVLRYGGLSILRVQATKNLNPFEGDAFACPDANSRPPINHLTNFGFVDAAADAVASINWMISKVIQYLGSERVLPLANPATLCFGGLSYRSPASCFSALGGEYNLHTLPAFRRAYRSFRPRHRQHQRGRSSGAIRLHRREALHSGTFCRRPGRHTHFGAERFRAALPGVSNRLFSHG